MKDLIIERKEAFGSKVQISLNSHSFEFIKSFFSFNKKAIRIDYDKFIHEPGSHIYFYNKNQRVSVVYTEDLEIDFIQVSEDNGISINFSSNEQCAELFGLIENKLTTANSGLASGGR